MIKRTVHRNFLGIAGFREVAPSFILRIQPNVLVTNAVVRDLIVIRD